MPVLSCSLSSVAQAQQSAKRRWKSCCTALLSQPWTALPALTYGLPISFVESLFLLKGNHGQLIHHKASRMFEACLAHRLSHRPLENRRPTKQLSSAALPGKDTPNRILLNWNNPLIWSRNYHNNYLHEGHLTSGSPESNDWQFSMFTNAFSQGRVRQWAHFSYSCMENVSIKLLGCTFLHILSICTNVNLCQKMHMCEMVMNSNRLACVYVCMFALKIAANHDLGRVFRLFHQTSSLDLLEPSAVKPSQEVIKAPNFRSRATPSLASLRNPPCHLALQPQHPILLFSKNLGQLGCKVRQWREL